MRWYKMKKITIILTVVFCLISFGEISYLTEEPSSPGPGYIWSNKLSGTTKIYFVMGFISGMEECLDKLTPIPIEIDSGRDVGIALQELIDLYCFVREHKLAVMSVMDDLYKDPANTYIILAPIIEIACQKLKGEDIEPLLQKARKEALP